MLNWLLQQWLHLYEKRRIYLLNPCDVDASPKIKPLGTTLALLGSHCKCCSGTRVLVALAVGALWPKVAAGVIFCWAVGAVVVTVWIDRGSGDVQ